MRDPCEILQKFMLQVSIVAIIILLPTPVFFLGPVTWDKMVGLTHWRGPFAFVCPWPLLRLFSYFRGASYCSGRARLFWDLPPDFPHSSYGHLMTHCPRFIYPLRQFRNICPRSEPSPTVDHGLQPLRCPPPQQSPCKTCSSYH